MTTQFEDLTIGQLRKLNEEYPKLQDLIKKQEEDIKLLKIKYPNKSLKQDQTAEEVLGEIGE
ncbi:hypothetical protein LCGC14_1194190 [marine sediment metagenome]|uniref:Uncharacterized protein n=1 Tax=marine sediment metagenome TaxID=412755 RepID=A0A0F9M6C9_9ZZZZ